MRTAEEIYLSKSFWNKWMNELTYSEHELILDMINEVRKEALEEACNRVKTYKVGNSGSWHDAAVDKSTIIELIKQLK